MNDNDAWSLYWQGKPLNSCITNEYKEDGLILERCWTDFVDDLDANASVVDLATGNGSVLMCLVKHRPDLQYIGVDFAELSPESHFVGDLSRKVSFITKTDIAQLPFDSDSIDAITSQFGFEYSSVFDAAHEMVRVLKTGAKFQLILHHNESEILKSSARRQLELELLLAKGQVIDAVEQYVKDEIDVMVLENVGKSFIHDNPGKLSESLSGQIFTVINQAIELKESAKNTLSAIQLIENMRVRIMAELSRLSQLSKAALAREDIEQIIAELSSAVSDIDLRVINPYEAEDKILSWLLSGKKC